MDNLSKQQRSYCMSRIKSTETKIELMFRKDLYKKGLRGYRLKSHITGNPDLYFPKNKIAVFIDGCFWHKCPKCFIKPKSNNEYWDKKIKDNVVKDSKNTHILKKQRISVIRFWEHDIKNNVNMCHRKLLKIYEKKTKNN